MNYKDALQSLGLSRHEIDVYIALLELGPSSPTQIEKRADLHRPFVYKALASLQLKGLATITPRGARKIFIPESPDKLIKMFRIVEDNLFSNLEDLHKLYANPKHEKPTITYAAGESAVRNGMRDVVETLNKGDIYYRYSPGYELFDRKRFLPRKYEEMRDRKQLERYIIVNDDGKKHKQKLGKYTKAIPRSFDLFNDRIGLVIYADKVLIADYESQSAITIKHAKFAEFQKKIFKFLYSKI